jgi:hypothetical protein
MMVVLVLACLPGRALAQSADQWDAVCVHGLSDQQVSEQLAIVEHSFAKQRLPASLWWTTWNAFNIFNAAFGFYKYADAETRLAADTWLVSSIGAALFVADVSILPLTGIYGYRRLKKLPDRTPTERRIKLMQGIRLLDRAAELENANSNWVAHLVALAYATISTSYVWIRNRNANNGELTLALALQFSTSMAVAELTFWTVPRRARRDRQRLRHDVCNRLSSRRREHRATFEGDDLNDESSRATLSVQVGFGSIALVGRF